MVVTSKQCRCPACGQHLPSAQGGAYVTMEPAIVARLRSRVDAEGVARTAQRVGVAVLTLRRILRGEVVRRGTALLVALRASSIGDQALAASEVTR